MSVLVTGPDYCEFGWNLMTFNPALRHIAKKFHDKIIVVTQRGLEYLYEFADEFYYAEGSGYADRWLHRGRKIKVPGHIKKKFPKAVFIAPNEKLCTKFKREYRKFGEKEEGLSFDVVIHARNTKKYGQHRWNWHRRYYKQIVNSMQGLKICSVGTLAHHIPGTENKLNVPINELCDIMASSKVLIGPSSGPMHLGSLCGIPHIVWTSAVRHKSIKATNRKRYEKLWNPFGTKVKVIDKWGWHPPAGEIMKAMEAFL